MFKEVIDECIRIVGQECVLTEKEDLLCYSYDATPDSELMLPDVVVAPNSRKEVVEIVKLANKNNIPIYTRGGGTNLSGGTIPVQKGIVLSTLNMNKILEIDRENLTATVEPGVVIQTLLDAVSEFGLLYPPDPGTVQTATLGGSVAECSGGLRGLKYGVTKDYVMGMEVVLADGNVLKLGGKTVKNVTGYDLVSLFIGSEGTLAVITEITLKLIPIPEYRQSMMAVFMDLDKAANTIREIIANKVIPATLEIMDNVTIRTVENYKKIGLPIDAEAILLIEVDGVKEAALKEGQIVQEICKHCGAEEIRIAANDVEREELWAARRAALPALVRIKPTTILEDATVPRSRIPEMIKKLREISLKYDVMIGTFGHAGDGNLHPTILTDENDSDEMDRVHQAIDEIFAEALKLGGTLSGEHGIGMAKAKYLEWEMGRPGIEAMRKIKEALDPRYILNPGKIFINK